VAFLIPIGQMLGRNLQIGHDWCACRPIQGVFTHSCKVPVGFIMSVYPFTCIGSASTGQTCVIFDVTDSCENLSKFKFP
jgi:hypothetical protein